ncbi:MAG: DUF6525 family protein [Pseudomonadota bacterium]
MKRNLGHTSLRRKRRATDPMRSFDALPHPLRRWLSEARLPWSPASARKLWERAQAQGLNADEALALLSRSETHTLARDKHAMRQPIHPSD